jgi:hypothetical protein
MMRALRAEDAEAEVHSAACCSNKGIRTEKLTSFFSMMTPE